MPCTHSAGRPSAGGKHEGSHDCGGVDPALRRSRVCSGRKHLPPRSDLTLGIGFGNFTGDLGRLTDAGVSWDARLGMNFTPMWGAELNYQGMHTSVGAILPAGGAAITGQAIVQHE